MTKIVGYYKWTVKFRSILKRIWDDQRAKDWTILSSQLATGNLSFHKQIKQFFGGESLTLKVYKNVIYKLTRINKSDCCKQLLAENKSNFIKAWDGTRSINSLMTKTHNEIKSLKHKQ